MSLGALPPELYSAVLAHLSVSDVQATCLALTRAVPYAPVPLHHLFESIHLCGAQRVVQLHRRLRNPAASIEAGYVREFRLETWQADPQVVINVLALLNDVTSLSLFVGPNFAPEDLLEVFERPRAVLDSLTLRFRPYVQRANYYQFLKGAYFDSTLSMLARWPKAALRTLSIIQDPYTASEFVDSDAHLRQSFAQPLVFFTFQPFQALAVSPAAAHVHSLRLRVPSRDIVPFITASLPSSPLAPPFPVLRLLDLSTCAVGDTQLERLLIHLPSLRHITVDDCALLRNVHAIAEEGAGEHARGAEWAALGKLCALAGVRRARERERVLKAWLEAFAQNQEAAPAQQQAPHAPVPRVRAGRKGLATAAISLRRPLAVTSPVPASSAAANSATAVPAQKMRILPPPPKLYSLSTTLTGPAPSDGSVIAAAFARGWADGVTQLRATWRRLRTSQAGGVCVVTFTAVSATLEQSAAGGLDGLEDVGGDGAALQWSDLEDGQFPCPVLCLAGQDPAGDHADGCSHRAGWEIWRDYIA